MPPLLGSWRAETWSKSVVQSDGSVTLSGNARAYFFEGKTLGPPGAGLRLLSRHLSHEHLNTTDAGAASQSDKPSASDAGRLGTLWRLLLGS